MLNGGIPRLHHCFARFKRIDKLEIAAAIGLLAVAGQEVSETRAHVAAHVLDDDGD
jgi:hypothetical protein